MVGDSICPSCTITQLQGARGVCALRALLAACNLWRVHFGLALCRNNNYENHKNWTLQKFLLYMQYLIGVVEACYNNFDVTQLHRDHECMSDWLHLVLYFLEFLPWVLQIVPECRCNNYSIKGGNKMIINSSETFTLILCLLCSQLDTNSHNFLLWARRLQARSTNCGPTMSRK